MEEEVRPGGEQVTFNLVFPAEFKKTYIAGFDPYEPDFKPCEGLFAQLNNGVFEYNTERRGITKRDIVSVYIQLYGEYEMPYSKVKVISEEQFDIEVDHFYFLSKYNLL